MSVEKTIKLLCSAASAVASFLWGQLDGLMLALIVFMIIDYVTGIVKACVKREMSSRVGFLGIAKKGVMLLVVAIGHIIDTQLFGGGSAVCRSALIGFYLANEGLSIMENTNALGVPWPPALTKVLRQLKGNENEEDDKDDKQ